jgi:Arc/MetJ-type ribon-helix-helix transcriptional regulator
MAHALTDHYEDVISRLVGSGRFANRSEVVRAGLRRLEEEFFGEDYLRPPRLPPGTLRRVYGRQRKAEQAEELQAVRASRKPRPGE